MPLVYTKLLVMIYKLTLKNWLVMVFGKTNISVSLSICGGFFKVIEQKLQL